MRWKSEDRTSLGGLRNVWPACLLATADSPAVSALNSLTVDGWNRLIDEALRHDVAVYLHYHLGELQDAVDVSVPAQERLRLITRQATVLSLRREHELRQILATLNEGGITPTLLKGAALAQTVYPSPACRSMVDFDLWLADEEMTEAQARLESLGYQVKRDPTRTLEFQRRYEGELVLISPHDGRTSVELHWGAFVGEWIRRTATVNRVGVVQRRKTAVVAGQPVWLMAPEDAFLQILLHAAVHHQMALHALRSLLDLALLLRDGADLGTMCARAQAWRIATVTRYMLDLLGKVLDLPAVRQAATALPVRSIAQHTAHHLLDENGILRHAQFDTSRTRYLFLALLADRPVDAARLCARMLWPEREWLRLRYDDDDLCTRVRHCRLALSAGL